MKLAKVVGNIVSTIKTPSHQNSKLMLVTPIDTNGSAIGTTMVAIDRFHAGIGDKVLILEEGGSAREVLESPKGAVDAIIVGLLDERQQM
jgi:microcompartment protein CcmK/EutM